MPRLRGRLGEWVHPGPRWAVEGGVGTLAARTQVGELASGRVALALVVPPADLLAEGCLLGWVSAGCGQETS